MACFITTARSFLGLALVISPLAFGQRITPAVDPNCGVPRLTVATTAGQEGFELRAGTSLENPATWETLLRFAPGQHERIWFDPDVSKLGRRFYRLETRPPAPLAPLANLALNDQRGRRHELLREGDARAVVLVFADNASLPAAWAAVKPLQERFAAQNVRFWLVNPRDPRDTITDAAEAAGVTAPVLHDTARLVARTFGATRSLEVVAIDRDTFTTFYQGALLDRCEEPGGPPEQNYLAEALEHFLAGQPVPVEHARASGAPLALEPVATPDYSRDIAPLLQQRCVGCHRPGDIGSWAMTDHATVKLWAPAMRQAVLTGQMPPWHADPAHGSFANDFSLRPAEAAQLVAWLDAGAPRGEGADPLEAEPPEPPAAWPLGQPDRVLSIPTQSIPATGEVAYRYLIVANPLNTDVWLRAASVRPGNRAVVHHCLVFVGEEVVQLLGGLGGFFAGYVPGMEQVEYPAGTGKRLPAGGFLVFQMHYTPNGTAATDRTELGLYFADTPPARELRTTAAYRDQFFIAPGVRDHELTAETLIAEDSLLYEMSPHMHYRGARMRFEAFYPDGSSETLLNVPGYEFAWQALYRLAEPRRLPAGTRIRITGGFDNSPWNPWNPNPQALITFGEQTDDEMFIGYLNVAAE